MALAGIRRPNRQAPVGAIEATTGRVKLRVPTKVPGGTDRVSHRFAGGSDLVRPQMTDLGARPWGEQAEGPAETARGGHVVRPVEAPLATLDLLAGRDPLAGRDATAKAGRDGAKLARRLVPGSAAMTKAPPKVGSAKVAQRGAGRETLVRRRVGRGTLVRRRAGRGTLDPRNVGRATLDPRNVGRATLTRRKVGRGRPTRPGAPHAELTSLVRGRRDPSWTLRAQGLGGTRAGAQSHTALARATLGREGKARAVSVLGVMTRGPG